MGSFCYVTHRQPDENERDLTTYFYVSQNFTPPISCFVTDGDVSNLQSFYTCANFGKDRETLRRESLPVGGGGAGKDSG